MRRIYMNQDNHHFWGCHPAADMTVDGARRLVDYYARDSQVAAVLFCVNVQRALFPSATWETFWAADEPHDGHLKRGHGVANHLRLRERGVDLHAAWLERCRELGIEGWLTMRMNDCHGLKEVVEHEQDPTAHAASWTTHWASQWWREHPELRRAPYRLERSWEGAFDYAHAAVREHHLNLVRELCGRYDFFGLELDWLRWGFMFAPGGEAAGRPLLTDFVRQVRAALDDCAARVGHPVRLAHRLPAEPQTALALGYDPITWAREGLADMVTAASFLGGTNFDIPIELWRALLGPEVKLLAHVETCAQAHPQQHAISYEFLLGSAASALARGADGVYLFNECYRESDAPELLSEVLRSVGSLDTLRGRARRQAVTFPQMRAPGDAPRQLLPVPLTVPDIGRDLGRMEQNISLRIAIGPRPESGRACLRLGFDAATPPDAMADVTVRLNTVPVPPCEAPAWRGLAADLAAAKNWPDLPAQVARQHWYELPLSALQTDINMVEFEPPAVPGHLEWAEIVIVGGKDKG